MVVMAEVVFEVKGPSAPSWAALIIIVIGVLRFVDYHPVDQEHTVEGIIVVSVEFVESVFCKVVFCSLVDF